MSADTNLGDAANTVTLNGGALDAITRRSHRRGERDPGWRRVNRTAGTTLTLSGVVSGAAA